MVQLSSGSIRQMYNKQNDLTPTLQVLNVKKIESKNNNADRFRVVLSDGQNYIQGMLASQLNDAVGSDVSENAIIRVDKYVTNEVKGRRIVIVLSVTKVGEPCQAIGNPENIEKKGDQQQQQQQPLQNSNQNKPNQQPNQHAGQKRKSASPSDGSVPIAALNPYMNKWTIVAKVTSKTDIKSWDKGPTNQGSLFSIDLQDANGGEIRGTFFREAVDKWFDTIEKDATYKFSNGRLKMAKKAFTHIQHDYEITFDEKYAKIERMDQDLTISTNFNFVKIGAFINDKDLIDRAEASRNREVKDRPSQPYIDVCGVVQDTGSIDTITVQRNTPKEAQLAKLSITLVDDTNSKVDLTFWGNEAERQTTELEVGHVLAVKACKVSSYNGCSLATSSGSVIEKNNAEIARCAELAGWWQSQGKEITVWNETDASLKRSGGGGGNYQQIQLDDVTPDLIEAQAQPDNPNWGKRVMFETTATVQKIFTGQAQKPPFYAACHVKECKNKKMLPAHENDPQAQLECQTCPEKKNPSDVENWRWIVSAMFTDASGEQRMTAFNEQAMEFLRGLKAKDAFKVFQAARIAAAPQDPTDDQRAEFEKLFMDNQFKEVRLRGRATMDQYDGGERMKLHLVGAKEIGPTPKGPNAKYTWKEECVRMVQELESLGVNFANEDMPLGVSNK